MLGRRLLAAVQGSTGDPFTPFPSALYATRTVSTVTRSDGTTYTVTLTSIVPVTYDPVGLTVSFGAAIGRAGMTRQIYGFPVRSSYAQVLLLGRDYVAAPVAPGGSYPLSTGPNLPGSIVSLTYTTGSSPAQATTTVTGALTSPVVDGSVNDGSGGIRTGLSFKSAQDTYNVGARSAAVASMLSGATYGSVSVQVTDNGQETPSTPTTYDGTMATAAIVSSKTPTGYRVTKLVVNGNDVTTKAGGGYTLTNYPSTNWFRVTQGTGTFTGAASNASHSLSWSSTTTWKSVIVQRFYQNGSFPYESYYASTPSPTSSGGEYVTAATTQQTAQYVLALPQAPTVTRDDPVTVGLYPLTQTCSQSPSSTAAATGYAETTSQYDGYVPIVAAANGTIPAGLPKDSTPASVPWYLPTASAQAKGGTPQSAQFSLPTGQLVTATSAKVTEFKTAQGGFAPYKASTTFAATDNAQPQVTDTWGTCLGTVTLTGSSGNKGTVLVQDFFNAASWTLTADGLTATYNTGDALLLLTSGSAYPCLPTTSSIDAFVQAGTAPNVTYTVNAAALYQAAMRAFLWTSDQVPAMVTLTGLPGTAVDPLFDSPTAGAAGRDLAMTTTPTLLGIRNGTAYFDVGLTAVSDDVVPISQAGGKAGTTTYGGQTVVRVGVMRVTRQVHAIVAVKGTVGTVLPYAGTRSVVYWDLGQLVDGSGAPTGTYVSWQSPGQVWSRGGSGYSSASPVAYGPTTSYGKALTWAAAAAGALVNVANADYLVSNDGTAALDLATTTANPGATGNIRTITPPSGWSGSVYVLPHQGAILLVAGSSSKIGSQVSLDLGATWQAVTVSGTVPSVMSPLFAF